MEFKSTLTQEEDIHYISEADMIKFIDANSDMDWNKICDFVRQKGITNEDGERTSWRPIEPERQKHYNEHQIKWVNGFFTAHPWIKRIMIVFDD